jgi:hypothetical protein
VARLTARAMVVARHTGAEFRWTWLLAGVTGGVET